MTREEAIKILNKYDLSFCEIEGNPIPPQDIVEAFDMAIEALQKQEHDGCEGCKYTHKDQYEMPCLMCKQSKKDLWERREP